MARRLVAALAVASAMGCGLQFDRFDPVDASSDASAQDDDGAMDVARLEVDVIDASSDVTPVSDAVPPDGADAEASDGPTCGARGEPCCPGHMCQQGLMCRGSTCR
jgi:hypothetical protein